MVDVTDKGAQRAAGRGFGGLTQIGLAAIAALAVLAAIYLLSGSGRPFQISLDKEGRFSVEAKPGDNFATILDSAMQTDPRSVEALLGTYNFYKLTSPQLVDAMSRIDAAAPATAEVTHGMRQLLWNLAGPFKPPGTLDGADVRLLDALDDLDPHGDAAHASRLLAGIWERSLDRTGVFKPRAFKADVAVVRTADGAGGAAIYACPGSPLVGKLVTMIPEVSKGDLSLQIKGTILQDPFRFGCGGSEGTSLEALLAGKAESLGIDPISYAELATPSTADAGLPPTVAAKFQVSPVDVTQPVLPQ